MDAITTLMINGASAKKTSTVFAVVFWTEELKTSIVPVASIETDDRVEGRTTQVRWRKGVYPAKILRITENRELAQAFLEQCDQKMDDLSGQPAPTPRQPAPTPQQPAPPPQQPAPTPRQPAPTPRQPAPTPRQPAQSTPTPPQPALAPKAKTTTNQKLEAQKAMAKSAIDTLERAPEPMRVEESTSRQPTMSMPSPSSAFQNYGTTPGIHSAMDSILWPEMVHQQTFGSGNLHHPLPRYTHLSTSQEQLSAMQLKIDELTNRLKAERAVHAKEIEELTAHHAWEMQNLQRELRDMAQKHSLSEMCGASPGKVEFLQRLVQTFENNKMGPNDDVSSNQGSRKKLRYRTEQDTPDKVEDIHQVDIPVVAMAYQERTAELQSPSTDVPLVDCFPEITLSKAKLSQCILKADGKAELLVRELLGAFFTLEQLSGGKALGLRKAHNSEEDRMALDRNVVQAIKGFVLRKHRQPSGEPFLKDKEFNRVINSKCATARRTLMKKL